MRQTKTNLSDRIANLRLLSLIFCILIIGRFFYHQIIKGDTYKKKAQHVMSRTEVEPALRGAIFDRNGNVLASSIHSITVYANTNEVKKISGNKEAAAKRLAPILNMTEAEILEKFEAKSSISVLAEKLDPRKRDTIGNALRGIKKRDAKRKKIKPQRALEGIGIENKFTRVHTDSTLAANIIGFVNKNGLGLEGIEVTQNKALSGVDGEFKYNLGPKKIVIPESREVKKETQHGKNVYLTIDSRIQRIAEDALKLTTDLYTPESMCAVVMNPYTGEILALANYPSYDLSRPFEYDKEIWKNRAVTDVYEPGSTLKIIVVASALDSGVIGEKDYITTCNKFLPIGKRRIKCDTHRPFINGHGRVDAYKLIDHSCNIGATVLARKMGAQTYYDYLKKFGLVGKQNFGFGGEGYLPLAAPETWDAMKLSNVSFGQGIAVTPIQMAAAYCVIANGGYYVKPQIIKAIGENTSFKPKAKKRIISEDAAAASRRLLQSCVENGTGKAARIKGRTIGGKTGSAQMAVGGRYVSNDVISSFIGIAPAKEPELVIAVVVTKPRGSHYGAVVAAPVLREIADKTLMYMKVPTDAPKEK